MRKLTGITRALTLALPLGFGACGTGSDGDAPPVAAAAADSGAARYTVVAVPDGGSIRGTVRLAGTAPPPRTVQVTADTAVCGVSREEGRVRVADGGALAGAVVSLVGVRRGAPFPASPPPALDQRACGFTPHVVVVPAGDTVRVLNSDPLAHNVHTAAFDNRPVNRTQPAGHAALTLAFDAPERVRVRCDLHPWMSAWIVVADHPYYAVTDEAGAFVLADVPAGRYTLEVWHEALGSRTRDVTVASGTATDVAVDLTAGR